MAMKPFLKDEIGATTDEIADWKEGQQGGRDRYRNDAYYGNKNRCKISVGEGKSPYKTSNFGERRDCHGPLLFPAIGKGGGSTSGGKSDSYFNQFGNRYSEERGMQLHMTRIRGGVLSKLDILPEGLCIYRIVQELCHDFCDVMPYDLCPHSVDSINLGFLYSQGLLK